MKERIIILIVILATQNSRAIDYDSKVVCKNGVCEKKGTFKGIIGQDLKFEMLVVGQCLLDNEKKVFFRIDSVEPSSKKAVLISEIVEEPVTIIMKRDTVYSDSREFNVKLIILPCAEVNGQIINDEEKFSKCVAGNGKHSLKLFCEKERKSNF